MSYIYLASPYSSPLDIIREQRFTHICRVAAVLVKAGHVIFCPIAMSHPIGEYGGTSTSWKYWEKSDKVFLDNCEKLWVAKLEGWDRSTGVRAEIEYASRIGKPISFLGIENDEGRVGVVFYE